MAEDFLEARVRAEDILLGSLGYGEDASILRVERTKDGGYKGEGRFADGEKFDFECDDELDELQIWALNLLLGSS